MYQRTGGKIQWNADRDLWMHALAQAEASNCEPEWVGAEHPLFILYTSGSTGRPKGVQHSTGGFLLWAAQTMKWTFDWKPTDVFWCTADIGWITGHSYIAYGPLAVGGTQVLFEGVPTYPNAGRFWDMIAKHQVTVFYTAPTAIRSLIKAAAADEKVSPSNYDLSSLRILGSVGESINPEGWMWYYTNIGGARCPILDTWWQFQRLTQALQFGLAADKASQPAMRPHLQPRTSVQGGTDSDVVWRRSRLVHQGQRSRSLFSGGNCHGS